MAGNFSIEVSGTATVAARVRGDAERAKEASRAIATKAVKEAATTMRFLAPRSSEDNMFIGYDTLASRINWSRAIYKPGGAGGGGAWVAKAGVRRSPRFTNPLDDPAVYVYEGTGLFGPFHRVITSRAGNFMVFKYKGRWIITDQVKGQEPQRLWVDAAQDRANAVVAEWLGKFEVEMRLRQGRLA